jgi:hypothetical protein
MADQAKGEHGNKTCFVVGPIGGAGTPTRTHADWLLEGIIEPVFEQHFQQYKVTRSDKISEPGMIDSQIINLLLDADLVIADMSLGNANAFYEMGIRHMAEKPIIHMFLEGSDIPFDVKPYRAIPFRIDTPQSLRATQAELIKVVREAVADTHVVSNPVTRARGEVRLRQSATPAEAILIDEIRSVSSRLRNLESKASSKISRAVPRVTLSGRTLYVSVVFDPSAYEKDRDYRIDANDVFNMLSSIGNDTRVEHVPEEYRSDYIAHVRTELLDNIDYVIGEIKKLPGVKNVEFA